MAVVFLGQSGCSQGDRQSGGGACHDAAKLRSAAFFLAGLAAFVWSACKSRQLGLRVVGTRGKQAGVEYKQATGCGTRTFRSDRVVLCCRALSDLCSFFFFLLNTCSFEFLLQRFTFTCSLSLSLSLSLSRSLSLDHSLSLFRSSVEWMKPSQ